MRIYYWPEMDTLIMLFMNMQFDKGVHVSGGKFGWYISQFPLEVLEKVIDECELVYES